MTTPEDNLPAPQENAGVEATGESSLTAQAPVVTPAAVLSQQALPEDLRTPWSWGYLVLFVVLAFFTLIFLELSFEVYAMVRLRLTYAELQRLATTSAAYITARQALWFAALMLYLFVLIRGLQGQPFWRTIGWRPLRPRSMTPGAAVLLCLVGGCGLAFAISLVGSRLIDPKTRLPIQELLQDRQSVLLVMVLAVLAAPLVEETIFRGYIYPVVARSFGVPAGVLVTGILFGLLHAMQLGGAWGLVTLLAVVGIVLTYVRARTGTVLASYLLHLGYNSMLFVSTAISTHGFRHFPTSP